MHGASGYTIGAALAGSGMMVLATHSSSRKPSHFSPAPKRGKIRARSAFSRRVAAHARGAQTAMCRTGRDHAFGTARACSGGPRAHIRTLSRCPPLPAAITEKGVVSVEPVLNGTAIVATPAEVVSEPIEWI